MAGLIEGYRKINRALVIGGLIRDIPTLHREECGDIRAKRTFHNSDMKYTQRMVCRKTHGIGHRQ